MAQGARNKSDNQHYSDEERRTGIARLLAEAYCARLRTQGKLKKLDGMKKRALPLRTRYDFLQGPEAHASATGRC